jgi:hypothetical protein
VPARRDFRQRGDHFAVGDLHLVGRGIVGALDFLDHFRVGGIGARRNRYAIMGVMRKWRDRLKSAASRQKVRRKAASVQVVGTMSNGRVSFPSQ